MQGAELEKFTERIVRAFPSKDGSKRIVILQHRNGCFFAIYEEIDVYDEEEWNYFCRDSERFPAWWEQGNSVINNPSFYGTEEEIMKDIANTVEYKTYFS